MRHALIGLLVLSSFLLPAGCGDHTSSPPPPVRDDGTVQGHIGDADFRLEIHAGQPGDPLWGPFLLQGRNLHYNDDAHVLIVDLTVKNLGGYPHHEPIGLTFIRLDPAEVTVTNPDNEIHDDGAAIVFRFANDDGVWTPDEESLPRTVQFAVSRGVSIAFVARLDIRVAGGGTIDGVVWNDANQNGVRDDDEPGVPGMDVYWGDFAHEGDSTGTREFGRVVTDGNGRYVIGPLRAGGYVVTIGPSTAGFFPTTPTEIHVLLVEVDGEVSSYHNADFGGVPAATPPPMVGQRVRITGKFSPPESFHATTAEHVWCPDDSIPDPAVRDPACIGARMRGPVTEIAPTGSAFRVMATWIISDAANIPPDLHVGDRVDVHVIQGPGPAGWMLSSIDPWRFEHDELQGRVDAVDIGPDGQRRWLVLNTWVVLANTIAGRE